MPCCRKERCPRIGLHEEHDGPYTERAKPGPKRKVPSNRERTFKRKLKSRIANEPVIVRTVRAANRVIAFAACPGCGGADDLCFFCEGIGEVELIRWHDWKRSVQ